MHDLAGQSEARHLSHNKKPINNANADKVTDIQIKDNRWQERHHVTSTKLSMQLG